MDCYNIVKFTHKDGHYFYAYTKNIRKYVNDIVRSTNVYRVHYKSSAHTGFNNLAFYCFHSCTDIRDWDMEIIDFTYFRLVAPILKNKLIDYSENKDLCLNLRKEHVLK